MGVRSFFASLLVLALSVWSTAQADYKAGFARTVITPAEPTWLSGYGARTRPAEGKVDELYAKAAAFESTDGIRLVLVTLDLGSISPYITDSVAAAAQKRFDLPRASLVLNCSHTHCAPEVAAERRVFHDLSDEEEGKLAAYIEKLNAQLIELVGAALADLQPARLSVGRSSAPFAFNRRHRSGIDKNGVTDRDVPVLRITDPAGKLRGVLFGYACHNTTLNFQQYCGDYAGFAQQYVEEAHPGAVALFVMGCGGDQNPQPRHGKRGLEYARQHGRELADAVEQALTGEQTNLNGTLRIAYDVATLDLEPLPSLDELQRAASARPDTAQRKARYLKSLMDQGQEVPLTQSCPLHVARFGDELLMIFISGETVVDYAVRCKADFAGPLVWIAGYCDNIFAYLPSRRVLLEGGYEGRESIVHQLMATPFQPNVEERVMDGVSKLIAKVNSDKSQ